MRKLKAVWSGLGALPAAHVTWGLACIFAVWVILDVVVFHFSTGVANSTYDAMVRSRVLVAAADPRLIIIDIDEPSLARMAKQFGRWPWSRDTLATVLTYVEKQQPAAIVWDILFSDADLASPGGDSAFNTAVQRSKHSHFPVIRLLGGSDADSRITRAVLPDLWISLPASANAKPNGNSPEPEAVALIPPFLEAVAKAPLGFNNAHVDADGILRRYRYVETALPAGQLLQSLPLRVLETVDHEKWKARVTEAAQSKGGHDELIAWRRGPHSYPRVAFADVFAQAEGGQAIATVPSFAGRVVVIGATAPALHDVHPTPLSALQPGVDSLATAIDNALNGRRIFELPRVVQAGLAVVLCLGIACWAQRNSLASLEPALFLLPSALLGISYLSLNNTPAFIDLNLSAGLALTFLLVLRQWNNMRRDFWCALPEGAGPMSFLPLLGTRPWVDSSLERLIDIVQANAPLCRLLVLDARPHWPHKLRWPELARCAAIIGPAEEIARCENAIREETKRLRALVASPALIPKFSAVTLAGFAFNQWSLLERREPSV